MKFSTRTTYGLRAIINLAKNKETSISLATIARDEKISVKYLEKLFASLKKSKLVKSSKGVLGGYQLSKLPNKVTVFDIVQCLEGDMNLFHCLDTSGKVFCGNKCNCQANYVLAKVQTSINNTLKNITLDKLI